MWHVKYNFGKMDYEYTSGFVGHGKKYHAVDGQHHTLCGIEYRPYQNGDVGFSHSHQPINCGRCLRRLNVIRKGTLVKNWVEE